MVCGRWTPPTTRLPEQARGKPVRHECRQLQYELLLLCSLWTRFSVGLLPRQRRWKTKQKLQALLLHIPPWSPAGPGLAAEQGHMMQCATVDAWTTSAHAQWWCSSLRGCAPVRFSFRRKVTLDPLQQLVTQLLDRRNASFDQLQVQDTPATPLECTSTHPKTYVRGRGGAVGPRHPATML
jgi:hypothetical protein